MILRFLARCWGAGLEVIKDPDDETEGAKMVMASAEDFFMSLFEVEHQEPDLKLKSVV